jgi:hypothetical protein
LLTVLIGVVAQFLKRSRESQDRTEILLAQLQDARDDQARAAAIAERSRIAQSCTTCSRTRSPAPQSSSKGPGSSPSASTLSPPLSDAIDRASELVKAGLANARQAVGTLRGDALPTLARLPALIDSYKADMNLDVTLRIEGDARTLPADPSLALYRGAQEALTNIARYAPPRAPPSPCNTNVPARSFPSTTAPRPPDREKEWAAATDSKGCASGSSRPAARSGPARPKRAGASKSRCPHDHPRPHRRRPTAGP